MNINVKALFKAIFLTWPSWKKYLRWSLFWYLAIFWAPWDDVYFIIASLFGFIAYYVLAACPPLKIYANGGAPWQNSVLQHMPCLEDGRGYFPTWFLINGSVQTLFAAFCRGDPKMKFKRERVEGVYDDGEVMVLDWSYAKAERSSNNFFEAFKPRSKSSAAARTATGGGRKRSNSARGSRGSTTNGNGRQPPSSKKATAIVPDELAPVVIIFHGLSGGTEDPTINFVAKYLNEAGFHAVVPVRAGCGEEGTMTKGKHYAYGDVDNVVHMVDYIAGRLQGRRLYGVGISAGSNVMCNYFGITGSEAKLSGGVSVANGFEWDDGTAAMAKYHPVWDVIMCAVVSTNLYHRHSAVYVEVDDAEAELEAEGQARRQMEELASLAKLQQEQEQQEPQHEIDDHMMFLLPAANKPPLVDQHDDVMSQASSAHSAGSTGKKPKKVLADAPKKSKTGEHISPVVGPQDLDPQASLRHYDNEVSRKIHGFESLRQFYKYQSCLYRLHNVKRPVLFVNCHDDPLSHHSLWPLEAIQKNNNLVMVTTAKGGHLGWVDEQLWPFGSDKPTWMDRFIVEGISGMVMQPNPVGRKS